MKPDQKQPSPSPDSIVGMDLHGYVRLRTLLDSLECAAIRYFLRNPEGKGGRMNELNDMLMPTIHWLWEKEKEGYTKAELQLGCPEGYVDCQGVCVPYPCPE